MGNTLQASGAWFTSVEIEVNSRCNMKCSYCPNSILPPPDVPEFISRKIYKKILNELVEIRFSGRISYHFYGEPLLNPELEELVEMSKRNVPNAYQVLYTNGSLLSATRYQTLSKAGIKDFRVTKHDNIPIPKRSNQTVLFPNGHIFCNRGGVMYKLKKTLNLPCYAPSEVLIVTITGDVLLCCNDSRRNCVMGNLTKNPLHQIWFSERFCRIRKILEKGQRKEAFPICQNCDSKEYLKEGNGWSWEGIKKN